MFPLIIPTGDDGPAYEIERSLLCDGSSYLSRTPGSAGNRKALTVNIGIKRAKLGTTQYLYSAGAAASDYFAIFFDTSDRLNIIRVISSTTDAQKVSNAVFRDPSAHGFLTVILDAANTSLKAFWCGEEITSWSTDNDPLNIDGPENNTVQNTIGARSYSPSGTYFEGIISEPRILDGVTPSDDLVFVVQDAITSQFKPRFYSGSYGAQGGRLLLDNNASTTTLGEDASGNGNDWTLTGFTTDDSVIDTPTNNFCTLNPLDSLASGLSEGNLKFSDGNGVAYKGVSTFVIDDIADTQKYYVEYVSEVAYMTGIVTAANNGLGVDYSDLRAVYSNGQKFAGSTASAYGASFTASDQMAMLVGDGQIEFFKNNVSQGVAFSGLTGAWKIATVAFGNAGQGVLFNFGQKPFAYTPPAGSLPLSTANFENPGEASPLTGSFTGNANADGRFVWLGYPPDTAGTCTINSNAITWGTHADALANGFKLRTSSASYNAAGSNTYSIAIDEDASFADNANAQVN